MVKFTKCISLWGLLSLLVVANAASASGGLVAVDRYSLVKAEPTNAELDPLSVNIKMSFPPNVVTVRDAIEMVMAPSGWVLAEDKANDEALAITLDRPLPQVHRELSMMPLRTALQVLVGQYFVPVEDPIRRIYTFDINEQFRGLVND
ncbi:hypothetical protein [Vibrio rotiferianus]|uniref:PFGI-1 class ICE element type IV pilus protein PilL2 n=1 Tax=Vibrio rotiferianus TaxID=190895 RepID=UPI000694D98E|nr:hypothetical protein [Vibrio rotiferianus]